MTSRHPLIPLRLRIAVRRLRRPPCETVACPLAIALILAGTAAALWVASLRCPCETTGAPGEGAGAPEPPLLALALLTPDDPRLPADPVDDAVEDWAALLPGIAPAGGGR